MDGKDQSAFESPNFTLETKEVPAHSLKVKLIGVPGHGTTKS